jgi:hypothetical protein
MVNRPLLLLLALLAAPPAAAHDALRTALDAVSHGWRDGITPERRAALENLARFDDARCVDGILDLFERDEVALFPSARRVLGAYAGKETLARLADHGLKHRDPVAREQVLLALGEARPAGLDWRAAARAGLDDPDPRVRAAAVRVLGRARDDVRLDRILALALDPTERVRLEVPDALARLAPGRSLGALKGLLSDPRWRVRLAAARALTDMRDPEAVLPLVDRLPLEPGRLREDLLDMLSRLTGHDFELDIEAWKKFLAQAPPGFLKEGDQVALGQRTASANASSSLPYRSMGTRYHTIPSLSRRFLLITDLSGSMDTMLPPDPAQPAVPRTRLSVARAELLRLVGTLTQGDAFDLLPFEDEAKLWREKLTPASENMRKAANDEIATWTPGGGTNVYAALKTAFDLAERALDTPQPSDTDFDTIFILTDGAPSAGAVRDADLLLQYAIERNQALQLRIHCVSLAGEADGRSFLKRLAEIGGGRYVELTPDG